MSIQKQMRFGKRYNRKSVKARPKTQTRNKGRYASSVPLKGRELVQNKTARICRVPGYGLPDEIIVTHAYVDTNLLATSAGTTTPYIPYSLNNIYDPDQRVGGHQPMFRDQLAALYGKYTVIGAKIVAQFTSDSALGNGPWTCGILGTQDSTLITTNPDTIMENAECSADTIDGQHNTSKAVATYSPTKLGCTSYDDDVGALSASYPNRQWYAHVWTHANGSVANTNVVVTSRIEYRVRWSMRLDNAGS